MITAVEQGATRPHIRHSRAADAFAVLVLAVAALSISSRPAEAMRECENPAYMPAVGACAHLPTVDLYYRDTGRVTGNGETVFLLHAGSGNADAFEHQFEALHQAGYRAIAYDRKNVGRSSNTLKHPTSTDRTVDDLDNLATYLGVDKFHLVGVAAGGQVALQYVAAKNPSRILSVVLAATLGPPGLAANEPTLAQLQRNISVPFEVFCTTVPTVPPPPPGWIPIPPDGTPPTISTAAPATVVIPEIRPEHRELGSTFRAANRPGVAQFHHIEENARHRTFDGCRFTNIGPAQPAVAGTDPLNPNTFAKIAALIAVRTLLVAGIGDFFFSPPAHMKLWGSHIHDVQYVEMGTGHAPQFEDPAMFNDVLLRFLKGGYPFERLSKKN
jgi:pimeloyl-ACP methyl ester carboxylesterase